MKSLNRAWTVGNVIVLVAVLVGLADRHNLVAERNKLEHDLNAADERIASLTRDAARNGAMAVAYRAGPDDGFIVAVPSAVVQFKLHLNNGLLPTNRFSKVVLDSVEPVNSMERLLMFKTEDGKTWQTHWNLTLGGNYSFDDPTEITPM
jgi:hypothetical protein